MKRIFSGSVLVLLLIITLVPVTRAGAALPAPMLVTPVNTGSIDQPDFAWRSVRGAVFYSVELSASVIGISGTRTFIKKPANSTLAWLSLLLGFE